ncbi:MAG: PIN domain-containing protein [Acidimicrobiaceae bacterium]|nr:PIN domain-containing protein [Acidimicrobiaceae bacterium]
MLLLDNSAWARLPSPTLADERRAEIAELIRTSQAAVSLPFLLEAGYSARSGEDHTRMMVGLSRLPRLQISAETEALALEVQSTLAEHGHHRVTPVDVIQAALAHLAGTGVLHYDKDYDVLRDVGKLTFESVWLAPRGTL